MNHHNSGVLGGRTSALRKQTVLDPDRVQNQFLVAGYTKVNSFFFPKLQDTSEEALHWLITLSTVLTLFPLKCLLNWNRINSCNQHWIRMTVVTVDFAHWTKIAINPLSPNNSQKEKKEQFQTLLLIPSSGNSVLEVIDLFLHLQIASIASQWKLME